MDENEKNIIRTGLRDYLLKVTTPDRKAGRDMYACPLCGSGTHGRGSTGALHYTSKTDEWYCHSCDRGGDIFTLHALLNKLDLDKDFPQIIEGVKKTIGLPVTSASEDRPQKDEKRMNDIEKYSALMPGSAAEAYLKSRGFSDEIIRKFKLGFNPNRGVFVKSLNTVKKFASLVIPYPGTDYFTERLLDPGDVDKYQNQTGEAPTFYVKQDDSGYFYITEGQLDALSMIQLGAKNVIASPNASKIEKLAPDLKMKGAVIVADADSEDKRSDKDNLTPGERKAQEFTEALKTLKIKSLIVYPPNGCKDSNDALISAPGALKDLLEQSMNDCKALEDLKEESPFKIFNAREYIEQDILGSDIRYFTKYKDRKTGFKNIDKHLILYPGLACLTGATSLGKTSFCSQLADQLIEKGETVLYFSLEQLTIELITKSLARRYYAKGGRQLSNIDIKNGVSDRVLEEVKRDYSQDAERLNYIECDFTVSADMIISYVEDYIKQNQVKPVVIVDYLQIISAPEGVRFDDRERIDDAVKKLKLLSKRRELFVLVISNMARSSYREKISEDSFKESGLIEYTCDYLFGLQLSILEDEAFFTKKGSRGGEKDTGKSERQVMIDEASEAMPKEVVFKVMKNRNGKKVFRAFFKYHPEYDLFEECAGERYDKNSPLYGFTDYEVDKIPFTRV